MHLGGAGVLLLRQRPLNDLLGNPPYQMGEVPILGMRQWVFEVIVRLVYATAMLCYGLGLRNWVRRKRSHASRSDP